MKTVSVNNFCGGSPMDVRASMHKTCGPVVSICQNSGGCSFQHSMRPKQAREMAAALIAGAEELDAMTITCEAAA